jgi:hypothetical protein
MLSRNLAAGGRRPRFRQLHAAISVAWALLFTSSCTYAPPSTRVRIENVLRYPKSAALAVLVVRTTFRQPTGLSTFPDGGKPKLLGDEAVIFLCDLASGEIRELARYVENGSQRLSFAAWLQGWSGGALYFVTTGCDAGSSECWGKLVTRKAYRIAPEDPAVRPVAAPPTTFEAGPNSPLARSPGETSYIRVSTSGNEIKVTATDPDHFQPALELRPDGTLAWSAGFQRLPHEN